MTDDLKPKSIKNIDDLHRYLRVALQLEHATIPPYLTALYSLKPGSNLEAFHAIRTVVVEEMLHLTLAANVLNAVGGTLEDTLTNEHFIPDYPKPIVTGVKVSLLKFSPQAVDEFVEIERSKEFLEEEEEEKREQEREQAGIPLLKLCGGVQLFGDDPEETFQTIGEFYNEIIRGLYTLHQTHGDALFSGQECKQVGPEYYYDGGGEIVKVTDLRSAIRALRVIQEQGEGARAGVIYTAEGELCHLYRFRQLQLGQYYQVKDKHDADDPDRPTGANLTVEWDAVYPIQENAHPSHYPADSEVYSRAKEFANAYRGFLQSIEDSLNGNPEKLLPAVGGMFKLKELATSLMRNPIPGKKGVNAAPIFRYQAFDN